MEATKYSNVTKTVVEAHAAIGKNGCGLKLRRGKYKTLLISDVDLEGPFHGSTLKPGMRLLSANNISAETLKEGALTTYVDEGQMHLVAETFSYHDVVVNIVKSLPDDDCGLTIDQTNDGVLFISDIQAGSLSAGSELERGMMLVRINSVEAQSETLHENRKALSNAWGQITIVARPFMKFVDLDFDQECPAKPPVNLQPYMTEKQWSKLLNDLKDLNYSLPTINPIHIAGLVGACALAMGKNSKSKRTGTGAFTFTRGDKTKYAACATVGVLAVAYARWAAQSNRQDIEAVCTSIPGVDIRFRKRDGNNFWLTFRTYDIDERIHAPKFGWMTMDDAEDLYAEEIGYQ